MTNPLPNPFSGLKTAKTFDDGEYLTPGDYDATITDVIWKQTEEKKNALIVEFSLTASSEPERHKLGAKRSWFQWENKSFESAALEFVIAACGYDRKDPNDKPTIDSKIQPMSPDILLAAVTKGVFKGRKVKIKVTHKITKEKKSDFHKYSWSPNDTKLSFDK